MDFDHQLWHLKLIAYKSTDSWFASLILADIYRTDFQQTVDCVSVVVAAVTTGLRRLLSWSWWAGGNDLISPSDDFIYTTKQSQISDSALQSSAATW